MNRKEVVALVEKTRKEMQANRQALTETAKAIHGEDYAKALDGTANIVLAIKACSMNEAANSSVHELLKSAIACVITCGLYQLFAARGIETVSPEGEKLADAFQKDIVVITQHGYKQINIKLEDLQEDDE